nr:putative transposase (putative), gypsy type [Tanacetum cinerariifolium]
MPTGKIGVYTRFFEFDNFRLPLSTFLVNVLRHYRINLSQLSVIAATKVSHFEILCRVHGIESKEGLFRCFYVNSKNKGCMSFKTYLFAFIQVGDPTKVKVGEQERAEEEVKRLDSTIGRGSANQGDFAAGGGQEVETGIATGVRIVADENVNVLNGSLLDDYDASREFVDHLGPPALFSQIHKMDYHHLFTEFNVGGSANQGDFAAGGGQEVETGIATGVRIVADENVVAERPKLPRKKRQAVTDASGSSHTPKRLRGTTELLVRPLLAVNLLSTTPEHESSAPADSITGLNIHTVVASKRFVISSDSSHHSSTNASRAEGNSIIRSVVVPQVMTEAVVTSHTVNIPSVPEMGIKVTSPVHASLFQDSDSTETMKADTASASYSAKQDLSMGSRELNSETLHQVFVLQ